MDVAPRLPQGPHIAYVMNPLMQGPALGRARPVPWAFKAGPGASTLPRCQRQVPPRTPRAQAHTGSAHVMDVEDMLDRFWRERGIVSAADRRQLVGLGGKEGQLGQQGLDLDCPPVPMDALPGVDILWSLDKRSAQVSIAAWAHVRVGVRVWARVPRWKYHGGRGGRAFMGRARWKGGTAPWHHRQADPSGRAALRARLRPRWSLSSSPL